MEPNWLDELQVLQETEHFKLCLRSWFTEQELQLDGYEKNDTYLIIYKPLNQIEHKHGSFNTARQLLWTAEALYETTEDLFSIDPVLRKPGSSGSSTPPVVDGNKLN